MTEEACRRLRRLVTPHVSMHWPTSPCHGLHHRHMACTAARAVGMLPLPPPHCAPCCLWPKRAECCTSGGVEADPHRRCTDVWDLAMSTLCPSVHDAAVSLDHGVEEQIQICRPAPSAPPGMPKEEALVKSRQTSSWASQTGCSPRWVGALPPSARFGDGTRKEGGDASEMWTLPLTASATACHCPCREAR